MAVEATLLIDFGGAGEDNNIVVFELDDDRNGDRDFNPNSEIFIRIQMSAGLKIVDVVATDGMIKPYVSSATVAHQEYLDFVSRDELEPTTHNISHISPRVISESCLGRIGGNTKIPRQDGSLDIIGDTTTAPYKLKLSYSTVYDIYKFTAPNVSLSEDESYPITIVLYVDDIGGQSECNSN